jgi:hypothetical protein
VRPPFPAFTPDAAAASAVSSIRAHGGTGLVDGFTIPAGTALYAGPDHAAAPVATVPSGSSLIVAEPVLWRTSTGARWLATFLACGGPSLYWIDLHQVAAADAGAAREIDASIATASAASTSATGVSTGRITVGPDHRFAWVSPTVTYAIGRGEYQEF